MEIVSAQYKHCDLISIQGRVDSSTAPSFTAAMNTIMDANRFKIVLDMSKIDFISSAGLRVLVNSQKNCKRYNRGEIVLAAIPEKIYSALDLAGFIVLFKVFPDITSAVGAF
jgi:anti-sigma B factor antagonist